MRSLADWQAELVRVDIPAHVALMPGRHPSEPSLKVHGVSLHSRYQPSEEAARLADSAALDLKRPILILGLGLGYHAAEWLARGAEDVMVIEPLHAVAKLALESGPASIRALPICIGDAESLADNPDFRAMAAKRPQLFVHPPSARAHPEVMQAIVEAVSRTALGDLRLHVAIVGPMFGGSLPIAGYLDRAFQALGHRTLYVDTSLAWPFYKHMTESVENRHASNQLGDLFANVLSEWCYARVAEFAPEICIVMAQAPVNRGFPIRLNREGIVTAFWYVENWRHFPYWRDIAPLYDYFFHIQPGPFEQMLDEAGCPAHAYIPTACEPESHRPVVLSTEDRHEYACDLSFAGAGYANRLSVFSALTDYNFKIWGVNWPAPELARHIKRPDERFDADRFAKIVAGSKINLNLHASATHDGVDPDADAINPRVFEIAACGGFQLCDPCAGLDRLFDFETELPVYKTVPELRARIDYFLAHPEARAEVARHARIRVLRDHTYVQRAQQMLDAILPRYGARILQKGVRIEKTMAEIIEMAGSASELGKWLGGLPPGEMFTYETICARINRPVSASPEPEKVFAYLREVRQFAEQMMQMPK